eukprot:5315652-Amphidinium_carterae.1
MNEACSTAWRVDGAELADSCLAMTLQKGCTGQLSWAQKSNSHDPSRNLNKPNTARTASTSECEA